MIEYIKDIADCSDFEMGTKAKNIYTLMKDGRFFVPATLIITTDFFKEKIRPQIPKENTRFDWNKLKLPKDFEIELLKKIRTNFKDQPLVVRSSATCEDSPLISFAGQYSTFLNIKTDKDILTAVKLCFQSLYNKNARIYARYSKVDLRGESIAIAIQPVIAVSKSGVMFTANPINSDLKEIIIEYGSGLGDKVVGGISVPDMVKVKRHSKTKELKFINKLTKIGIEIEKIFNNPQDIEWGIKGDKICIFQSRPITTLNNLPTKIGIPKDVTLIANGEIICMGQTIGELKIVTDQKQFKEIKKGDILFLKTKPNMELVEKIHKIRGLILCGGLLSHFAVIAREFSVPCLTQLTKNNLEKYNGRKVFLDTINKSLYILK